MIHMAYPWIFILLPLPWLIRHFIPKATSAQQSALQIPFFKQMQQALQSLNSTGGSLQRRWRVTGLLTVIWLLLLTAGSGLQWLGQPVELPRSARNIMIAIDLSGSMQTPDMKIDGQYLSRIAVVKQVANEFIAQRAGDRVGLLLFGTHAYLQTPLTFDLKTVQQMLNDATVGIAGLQTAIGDAVGLAIKRLMKYPKQNRALVLMTDGGNNAGIADPITAAKKAAQLGIKIYTIGLGANRLVVNGMFGPQVVHPSSDLDINGLKQMAKITGGKFFRAENGAALKQVYQQLNQLEPVNADKVTLRPVTPLYPYPLGLLLCLWLVSLLSQQALRWRA